MVRQETPLRRWWREESWIYLEEDSTLPPVTLEAAIGLAEELLRPGVTLDRNSDYSEYIRAFLATPEWDESFPEFVQILAHECQTSRTPYSLIAMAFESVYQRANKRELCIRARRNQGLVALILGDFEAAMGYTRDVMSLVPEGDQNLRPGVEVSVYYQRSRLFLQQRRYDQAFHHALHCATLANHHAGGRPVVETIYAHLALCAVLDDRLEMASAWVERLVDATVEGEFARDVVMALLQFKQGESDLSLTTATRTLGLWPQKVLRRKNAYLAEILVDLVEQILVSRGVPPHDIRPAII